MTRRRLVPVAAALLALVVVLPAFGATRKSKSKAACPPLKPAPRPRPHRRPR